MRIRVDTHIWVPENWLPDAVTEQITDALSFPNEEKETARREHVFGWRDLPDTIDYWEHDRGFLKLPRGFLPQLQQGLLANNLLVSLDDRRISVPDHSIEMHEIELYPHQTSAVDWILKSKQGIYQAPPGSGKTVAALDAIKRAGQRAIVLVNQTHIAEQWRERSRDHFGYNPGLIGDGVWDERGVTIALVQTLWSRKDRLDPSFWDSWGFVCLDECHHTSAESFQNILQCFPARYRIGISATPDKTQGENQIAQAVIGQVFHETTREELRFTGILSKPQVTVVKSSFTFPYFGTHVGKKGGVKRNNYQPMMKALLSCDERNESITGHIWADRNHHQLVVSRRLAHLRTLHELVLAYGYPEDRLFMLTGKESRERRMEIAHEVEKAPCVVFSTIADEALDIPRLDRLHLVWPQRNPDLIRQQVGRIERAHPDKTGAIVYDYIDPKCGVLMNQFKARRKAVYEPEQFQMVGLNNG